MNKHTVRQIEHMGSLGINGWTDYQLLRLLRGYDRWSGTPTRSGDIDRETPDEG